MANVLANRCLLHMEQTWSNIFTLLQLDAKFVCLSGLQGTTGFFFAENGWSNDTKYTVRQNNKLKEAKNLNRVAVE